MERAQTKPYFLYMVRLILFVLFDLGLVLKCIFSFVIYIIFKFSYLDTFIQSDLQMKTIEAIKINKRAMICNY